jgi:lipoyl(octanoyl) transferase
VLKIKLMSDIEPSEYFKDLEKSLNEEAWQMLKGPIAPRSIAKPPPKRVMPGTRWLGQMDYVESIQVTQAMHEEQIWGLEYPLTITLGKRADPLKDIKVSIKILREQNVQIVGVDRGGQATLHNPGQLVIYPHLDLRARGLKVREYVGLIESVTKKFLEKFGIEAFCRGDEPGLFTVKGKIAFFGVRVQRGFTSHGLSINVRNSLSDFGLIRSCGNAGENFSSMQDYGVNAPLSYLFNQWCAEFSTAHTN